VISQNLDYKHFNHQVVRTRTILATLDLTAVVGFFTTIFAGYCSTTSSVLMIPSDPYATPQMAQVPNCPLVYGKLPPEAFWNLAFIIVCVFMGVCIVLSVHYRKKR